MSDSHNNTPPPADWQHEMTQAHQALEAGHLRAALQHLKRAGKLNAPVAERERLLKEARRLQKAQQQKATRSGALGFWAAFVCYALLSIQQPTGWGVSLWSLLAFGGVPLLVGLLVGRHQGYDIGARPRFWTAWRACGWAMGLYTAFNLLIAHSRITPSSHPMAVFVVGVAVSLVYAVLAGTVAGLAGAKLAWWRGETEGTK